jgi:translation initiation factor eIF-2B subunit delta
MKSFDSQWLRDVLNDIKNGQPSMAVVLNVVGRILNAKDLMDIESIKSKFLKAENEAIDQCCLYLRNYRKLATISFSKSVLNVLLRMKPNRVFVSVSHPAREGEALARELVSNGIDVVLFEDAAYSLIMKDAEAVLIGADAVFDGCVVNKIGSYALALLAKEFKKPFYVVANKFKLLNKGLEKSYRILDMDPSEISDVDCKVVNVYFECVPKNLIENIFMG